MASAFNSDNYFRKQILKLIDKLIAEVKKIQASEKFVDYLCYQLSYLKSEITLLKSIPNDLKGLLIILLKAVATLLGYGQFAGPKLVEPYFIPSLWSEMQGWSDFPKYYRTKEYFIKQKRLELVDQLIKEGRTSSEIALILNISGYRIAQFRQQINANNNAKNSKK